MTGSLAWALAVLVAAAPQPVDFDTEVIPVLTKAGCNGGACHGAAAGRGGFRLSLLGGDPSADYSTIVHEFEGRRVNLARPNASLLLAKPTGVLSHEGDVALDEAGPGAERLASWIAAGAKRGANRSLTHFAISPERIVVDRVGTELPLKATARFNYAANEDVTPWTIFTAADPSAVAIDPQSGKATVLRPGQHVVVARFLDRVVPLQMTLPLSDKPVDLTRERRTGYIDEEVLKTLSLLRIPVSPPAGDAALLRRLQLDLTGALPEPDEVRAYLADRSDDKRARLIERLLHTEAFADYWTLRFGRLIQVHSLPNDKESVRTYHRWLRTQIRDGAPLDEVARQLLTATGDSHQIGPANFTRMAGDARAHAELVSRAFLGQRLQCANCHNHPLDRWTQDDYHGLAAVFARLDRGRQVKLLPRGAVTNLRTGEPAVPRLPGVRYLDPNADHRAELARWLTTPDNPLFARAIVNRLWQAMLGRGLVEPVDDLRQTNPATHPELLDRLAADFIAHGFDLRHTLRVIALSETYGRSAAVVDGNAADDRFYSHAVARSLEPEVTADMIADVTGVSDPYGDEPLGTRAVTIFDPMTPAPSLDVLGRCSRVARCEEMAAGGGTPAKLHLLNGELINRKIADPKGRLHRLIEAGQSDEQIVAEFYLRALGRLPREAERAYWRQPSGSSPRERSQWLEDFVWSLLNGAEFITNH